MNNEIYGVLQFFDRHVALYKLKHNRLIETVIFDDYKLVKIAIISKKLSVTLKSIFLIIILGQNITRVVEIFIDVGMKASR